MLLRVFSELEVVIFTNNVKMYILIDLILKIENPKSTMCYIVKIEKLLKNFTFIQAYRTSYFHNIGNVKCYNKFSIFII